MEGTIGEIRNFGGNFAPLGWAFCDGSLMSIAVYTAAYSIIGTTFGGDGITTFALPDFRGRIPVGTGTDATFPLGLAAGTESVTMSVLQMPMHNHVAAANVAIPAVADTGSLANPAGNLLAAATGIYSTLPSDAALFPFTATGTSTVTGGNQPFSIMQPLLGLNYIVCLEGVYPSRS